MRMKQLVDGNLQSLSTWRIIRNHTSHQGVLRGHKQGGRGRDVDGPRHGLPLRNQSVL
jgi:hypothetical protein